MALEYGLRGSPCSTEWIDVLYKYIIEFLKILWSHFIGMCAVIKAYEKQILQNKAFHYKMKSFYL